MAVTSEKLRELGPSQQGMLYHSLVEAGPIYVEQICFTISNSMDVDTFEAAWQEVMARHEILRASYRETKSGRLLQSVVDNPELDFHFSDLTRIPDKSERERRLQDFAAQQRARGFSHNECPLMRVTVMKWSEKEHRCLWTFHHSILDGHSLPTVFKELMQVYNARIHGFDLVLHELLQYSSYLDWLDGRGDNQDAGHGFWKDYLSGYTSPVAIDLPIPGGVHTEAAEESDCIQYRLDNSISESLRRLASDCDATLNNVVQAAWALLLSRYSGADDLVFGITRACRRSGPRGVESAVGPYLNVIPIRTHIDGAGSVSDFVRSVRARHEMVREHELSRLVEIQKCAEIPAGEPLFDTLVEFDMRDPMARLDEIFLEQGLSTFKHVGWPHYGITLQVYGEDRVVVRLKFRRGRYSVTQSRQILRHFCRLLGVMAKAPDQAVRHLDFLDEADHSKSIQPVERTFYIGGEAGSIHQAFTLQACRTPDAVAVSCRENTLSYLELDAQSTCLARRLMVSGVQPGDIVGLCVGKGSNQIVGMLGIMKAGAAYLPVSPDLPEQRMNLMLRDSSSPVIVTDEASLACIPVNGPKAVTIRVANEDGKEAGNHLPVSLPETSLREAAYVIYTSGSTGKPKGVIVSHENVLRLFAATDDWLAPGESDVWTMFHSFAFDFSVWEIWGALLHGGRLEIVPEEIVRAPTDFLGFLKDRSVTVLNQTPSAFRQLIEADSCRTERIESLRMIVFGGEKLDFESLKPWVRKYGDERPILVNMYGITETTVHVTQKRITKRDIRAAKGSVIGRALPDLAVRLCDRYGNLVPPGVPGEMWIGGAGVARGYLASPELNQQKFVRIAGLELGHDRFYRSGDFARMMPNGELVYLGRHDDQVKIRGYRIDLGEVSNTMRSHPCVADVAVHVTSKQNDVRQIRGYYVTKHDESLSEGSFKEWLREYLPGYMIPGRLFRLSRLPLTSNGKVDFGTIEAYVCDQPTSDNGTVSIRDRTERHIAEIWSEVLDRESIGSDDDFFALGGDSILALQVVSRAGSRGIELTPAMLFEHSTLRELARHARLRNAADSQASDTEEAGSYPATPIQQWFLNQHFENPDHWNQAFLFRIVENTDSRKLEAACRRVMERHVALRSRFQRDEDGQLIAYPVPVEEAFHFCHVELDHLDGDERRRAIDAILSKAQASLDIGNGLLCRFLHLKSLEPADDRLLIVIHHLAVDAVSWQILLEDIQIQYDADAPPAGSREMQRASRYATWARALEARRKALDVGGGESVWGAILEGAENRWPGMVRDNCGSEGNSDSAKLKLGVEATRRLTQQLTAKFDCTVQDILLAALGQACACAGSGSDVLVIDVERHGREQTFTDIDLTGTVGWFTSIHPLRLPCARGMSPSDSIAAVRSQFQRIAHHGVDWGLARYRTNRSSTTIPAVLFNYLGRFEQTLANRYLQLVNEDTGPWRAPQNHLTHALEIVGRLSGDELTLDFCYDPAVVAPEIVNALIAHYRQQLALMADTVQDDNARSSSRETDGQNVRELADRALDANVGDIVDVLPLSPLQRLYHAVSNSGRDVGFDQWVFHLEGRIEQQDLEQAWQGLIHRHDALRTVFLDEGVAEPYQAVLKSQRFSMDKYDWRGMSQDAQEQELQALLDSDRKRQFNLTKGPLTRVLLIQTAEDKWILVWSHHHLQVDGWSWPLLLKELGQIYDARVQGKQPELARPGSYRDYIRWLAARDLNRYKSFWKSYLEKAKNAGKLLDGADAAERAIRSGNATVRTGMRFSEPASRAVERFARQQRLTPGIVLQAAWALTLSVSTGSRDVCYGAAFSGRISSIPGMDRTVGSFVNNIPVLLQVEEDKKVSEWLMSIRKHQASLNEYQNVSPSELNDWLQAGGGHRLFDTLLVFQNYAVGDATKSWGRHIQVTKFIADVRTNYPVTLVITPATRYRIDLMHDSSLVSENKAKELLRSFRMALNELMQHPDLTVRSVRAAVPKVQFGRLREKDERRPDTAAEALIGNAKNTEETVSAICAEVLEKKMIDVERNFFDLGAHSIALVEIHRRVQQALDRRFPIVKLFHYPSVKALARFLDSDVDRNAGGGWAGAGTGSEQATSGRALHAAAFNWND